MALSPFSATWRNDIVAGLGSLFGITLDTDGTMAADSDARVASQKATRTYVASKLSTVATFSAVKSGAQTDIAATDTKLTFPTEEWDIGNYYDAANSKWVPPAGVVRISAAALVTAGHADGATFNLRIYKNGASTKARGDVTASAGVNNGCSVDALLQANGTDEFELYCSISGAGNKTISGNAINTYFQGEQVVLT